MKTVYVNDFLARIGGEVLCGNPNPLIQDVWTRWKNMTNHSILFAMYGSLTDNLASGIKVQEGVIVTDQSLANCHTLPKNVTIVKVANVRTAYWAFVDFYRNLFQIPVIGVTGTCGKTTTKEMIRQILEERLQVQSTYKSKNGSGRNLGYLLGIDEHTQAAVFEMGVQSPDDLIDSCRYFKPQIGILTMIGTDHLLYTGSKENYFREKCKLLDGLDHKGTLILNGDDANIKKMDLGKYRGHVIRYGVSETADFRATNIAYGSNGMDFTLRLQGIDYELFVPGYGEHNVYNALAALAAVHALGVGIREAGDTLRSFQHVERHLELRPGLHGSTILDDTWNTNPSSIEAALHVLKKIARGRKTVAFLGEIGELGAHSVPIHEEVGEKVVDLGIDVLVSLEDDSQYIAKKALQCGMNPSQVYICKSMDEAYHVFSGLTNKQTLLLLKTSMFHSYQKLLNLLLANN